jgi:antitoxin ParD1/3/4
MPETIPEELKEFVDTEIAAGKYRSPEEVIATALRLLQERERRLNGLRADLHIGLEQLEKGEGTVIADEAAHDAFFEEMENRLQQGLAG